MVGRKLAGNESTDLMVKRMPKTAPTRPFGEYTAASLSPGFDINDSVGSTRRQIQ